MTDISLISRAPISSVRLDPQWQAVTTDGLPLRGANDIVALALPPITLDATPALRQPKSDQAEKESAERPDVRHAIRLLEQLANLMGMLLKLELASSQMINASSNRETALAKVQGDARREAGRIAMIGAFTKAATSSILNIAALGISLKGIGSHLKSVNTNSNKGQKIHSLGTDPHGKTHDGVTTAAHTQSVLQRTGHEDSNLYHFRTQAISSSVQVAGTSASATIDGGTTHSVAAQDAERDIAAGDAGVANRRTDVQIKERARQEALRDQTFSTLKNTIQADLDVGSHVARATQM